MSALEIRNYIESLEVERALALIEGLGAQPAYMADLEEEIATSRQMYIGAAVTEIASLRSALGGPQLG